MMANKRDSGVLDSSAVMWGFVIGLLVGGIGALFKAPRGSAAALKQIGDTGHALRNKLETILPVDPITESMAEGKAAARRRRLELGLDK
jgi:hypothetical protein